MKFINTRSYGSVVDLKHIYCNEAETLVLGSAIQKEEDAMKAYDALKVTDFYLEKHQIIFSAIFDLYAKNEAVEFNSIYIYLNDIGKLDTIGGLSYLTHIACYCYGVDIDHYIKIMQNKTLCRNLLDFTENLQSLITKRNMTGIEVYREAQTMLMNLQQKNTEPLKSLLFEKELFWEKFVTCKEDLSKKLLTGYADLDKVTHGISQGRYWVIAARPSVGKTTFALNLIYNILKQEKKVMLFSIEMRWSDIEKLMLAIESKIPYSQIQEQDLDMVKLAELRKKFYELAERPLYIDDYANDIMVIKNKAKMVHARYGLDLIVIDYLQLIRCKSGENKQNEIAEISQTLRELSKELNVPVIVLSQLSRKVEERINKTPLLSDLRDSGSIEQDADLVMLLNRPDYYKPDHRPNEIDVIVSKNRYGECKTISMHFDKQTMRFNLLAKEHQTSINKIAYI